MLYLNAYIISRAYGGPEEGGWWYDVGAPVAAIPIPTSFEKGKDYYMQGGTAVVRECYGCNGTGSCEKEDEQTGEVYTGPCDCGEIPADIEALAKMVQQYTDLLKEEVGRREELRVSVERHMAAPFPERRPHYE